MAEETQDFTIYFRDGSVQEYQISKTELVRLANDFVGAQGNGSGAYDIKSGGQTRLLILRFDQVRNFA